jgi:hypothetical protein
MWALQQGKFCSIIILIELFGIMSNNKRNVELYLFLFGATAELWPGRPFVKFLNYTQLDSHIR